MTELCRSLVADELRLYDEEHSATYSEGESKDKATGSPIFLEAEGSEYGVLLNHGYLAQPEEVRLLADFIHSKGFSVYVPRLPGHGTTPDDLFTRSWEEWYDASRRGYAIVRECAPKVISAGFSMGAGLALMNASRNPGEFCAAISISAPIRMKGWQLCHAELIYGLQRITRAVGLNLVPDLLEHSPDNPDINYLRNPIRGVVQLHKLMREVEKGLSKITVPVFALQADEDPVIYKKSVKLILKKTKGSVKESHLIRWNIHGIVRGSVSKEVFEKVGRFLDKVRALTA